MIRIKAAGEHALPGIAPSLITPAPRPRSNSGSGDHRCRCPRRAASRRSRPVTTRGRICSACWSLGPRGPKDGFKSFPGTRLKTPGARGFRIGLLVERAGWLRERSRGEGSGEARAAEKTRWRFCWPSERASWVETSGDRDREQRGDRECRSEFCSERNRPPITRRSGAPADRGAERRAADVTRGAGLDSGQRARLGATSRHG